jgi:hypothetical protein
MKNVKRQRQKITIHAEFVELIRLAAREEHLSAIIVTVGLCWVWERVLERAGLSIAIAIVGGGRLADGYVVTP